VNTGRAIGFVVILAFTSSLLTCAPHSSLSSLFPRAEIPPEAKLRLGMTMNEVLETLAPLGVYASDPVVYHKAPGESVAVGQIYFFRTEEGGASKKKVGYTLCFYTSRDGTAGLAYWAEVDSWRRIEARLLKAGYR
jgi:hypothetical protein